MQYRETTQDIRSLVKNYTVVPGLILATGGGYLAFVGAFSMLWDKWFYWVLFGSNPNSWLANLGALGSLILPYVLYLAVIYAVRRYYKRHFGQVKPRAEEKQRLRGELALAVVAYFATQVLDIYQHSAVSITLLVFALFLIIHWWMFVRMQIHYLLLAAIAVVLSFVPLFNSTVYFWLYVKYTSPDWYGFNIAVCTGLLLLLAGLLDHWHMLRMFARVRNQVLASS